MVLMSRKKNAITTLEIAAAGVNGARPNVTKNLGDTLALLGVSQLALHGFRAASLTVHGGVKRLIALDLRARDITQRLIACENLSNLCKNTSHQYFKYAQKNKTFLYGIRQNIIVSCIF